MKEPKLLNQVVRPKRMDEFNYERSLLWSDIKDFCGTLSEEELCQPVMVWGEEKGGGIYAISKANEDGINPSGEGVEPVSLYAESDNPCDREIAESETVSLEKGQIILECDF